MSAHPTKCPRCGDLLGMAPGTSLAQCLRCGGNFQLSSGAWRSVAEAPDGGPSPSTGKGCAGTPPHAGVPVGQPYRPAIQPATGTAAENLAPTTSKRDGHGVALRIVAGAVFGMLVGIGINLALGLYPRVPEQPAEVKPPVRPRPAVKNPPVTFPIVTASKGQGSAGKDGAASAPVTPAPKDSAAPVFVKVAPKDLSGTVPIVVVPPPKAPVTKESKSNLKSKPVPEKAERKIYQTVAQDSGLPKPGASRIDELVFGKLKEKNITPAVPCSDAVFVRRVYLDVIGTLPTAQEAKSFFEDSDPNKRQILIDRLLERKEFADYWAMKWGDILRVKSEFPINLWPNAVRAYHRWIRASIRENVPYDQFARAMLTSSGSNFRDPSVNFYRALQRKNPPTTARAVALTFMGVRPEGWLQERWAGMAPFFSQVGYKSTLEWKEEIVFFDSRKPLKSDEAVFPDGTKASLLPDHDPRLVFADWLITPQNPWFTRNVTNRVWSWLLGRGIIHEPDDIRPDNPPSNPELLAYLEQELIAVRYDLKHLYRLILNSKAYQLSCIAASDHPEAAALFAAYPVRRLEAEVLIDAICQITGTTERYSSPIPEPFTYLPHGHRAISLPDASITSAFLDMFGRSPRDTGLESERNNTLTAAQRLHLLNSSHIQRKIEKGPGLAAIIGSGKAQPEIAKDLYLTILSRYPTQDELAAVATYVSGGARGRSPAMDIAWALINSAEFLCRH